MPAIRVGLEPGYGNGRAGAWIADLPGCFVSARDRDVALARAPSAVGAFADWLARHGEAVSVPHTDRVVVIEEVPATQHGGHERNAFFEFDLAPVGPDAVEATLRRLTFARQDLLALWSRIRERERANGAGDGGGLGVAAGDRVGDGRDALATLRHLGGAEVWLATRLEPDARYEGPARDGDVEEWLGATRAWAVERIWDTVERDARAAAVDGNGEQWTLAKVLRRLVYHSLDHLGELDRAHARASGAADALVLRRDVLIEPSSLEPLFRSVGWYRLLGNSGRLARLLEGSTEIVSVWDGPEMVGFARAISDQAAYGLISTVAVHPRWQGKGVARRLITALMENNDGIRFSLSAVPGAEGLYASVGFVPDERAMVRRRLF